MDGQYIIMVDDDDEDRDILKTAFQSLGNPTPIKEYRTGTLLLKDLDEGMPLPCLFVVDLNMPEIQGVDLIPLLKDNHLIRHIPTLVFATDFMPSERQVLDRLGIECFKKPDNIRQWEEMAEVMNRFCVMNNL